MAAVPTSIWSERIVGPFRASPKKATVLAVLAVTLVGSWVKMISGGKGPRTAQASAPQAMVDRQAQTPLKRPMAAGQSLTRWARRPVGPMTRNLFAVPLDYYPRDVARGGELSAGGGFWDRLAKSVSAHADEQEQRQILIDNVRIMAGGLKLQSTVMGPQPSAMVNGEMVREGSVVAGFRVLKIEARRMIVEREGIKLAILMK